MLVPPKSSDLLWSALFPPTRTTTITDIPLYQVLTQQNSNPDNSPELLAMGQVVMQAHQRSGRKRLRSDRGVWPKRSWVSENALTKVVQVSNRSTKAILPRKENGEGETMKLAKSSSNIMSAVFFSCYLTQSLTYNVNTEIVSRGNPPRNAYYLQTPQTSFRR